MIKQQKHDVKAEKLTEPESILIMRARDRVSTTKNKGVGTVKRRVIERGKIQCLEDFVCYLMSGSEGEERGNKEEKSIRISRQETIGDSRVFLLSS